MSHEQTPTSTSKEVTNINSEVDQARINRIVALASQAGEWNVQHGITSTTRENEIAQGQRGPNLAFFKNYVRGQAPGAGERDITKGAALLQADISRFLHPEDYKDAPALTPEGIDQLINSNMVSDTATFSPVDVIRYSVHMVKETELHFEGSDAESEIGEAVDAHFTALGRDPQTPEIALIKQEILQTV